MIFDARYMHMQVLAGQFHHIRYIQEMQLCIQIYTLLEHPIQKKFQMVTIITVIMRIKYYYLISHVTY